jgi:hypothetical protein
MIMLNGAECISLSGAGNRSDNINLDETPLENEQETLYSILSLDSNINLYETPLENEQETLYSILSLDSNINLDETPLQN